MKNNSAIMTDTNVDVGEETSKFAIKAVLGFAGLIGIWGAFCLIGGLAAVGGPIALSKAYLVALAL